MIAQPLFPKAKSKNSWNRPGDWLPLTAPSSQGFAGLHAVWENDSNFVAVTVAGAFTVDWGDGSPAENLATGATAEHIYLWADLPASSLTSRGYRQAIIRITPQSGQNLTAVTLHVKHSQSGLVSAYSSGWLELKYNTPNLSGNFGPGSAASLVRHRYLERVQLLALGSISVYQAFNFCSGLIQVDFPSNTSVSGAALFCEEARSLKVAPTVNTSSVTDFSRVFQNCSSLTSIPLYSLGSCTNISSAFSGCVTLKEIPALNLSSVTNFGSTFLNCTSLSRVRATGINATVSFANCSLSAAALNEIYTNLSATGSGKTITVTGNYGTSSDNPSIATAKGWTVTG
jgi:hypothetical protein